MFVWFLVAAPVLVAEVFRSPMIDYRIIALAAIAPLVEVPFGGPLFLHTLAAPVAIMFAVMVIWRGKRMVQRRWLGVPIGLFMHSILDGGWRDPLLFWWPVGGLSFSGMVAPEVNRPVAWSLAMDAAGVAVGVWAWHRYDLGERENRLLMIRSGRLSRNAMPGGAR